MNKFNIKIEDCRIVTLLVIIMFMCGNLNVNAQSMNMDASEGEYPDKVKITWSFSGFSTNPSSVEIKRDGEQIGFVNNNVILYYDDNDAIPGIIHEYATIPHNEYGVVLASSDTSDYGFVFPNGSISGTVSSPYGAGVEGVIVEAEGWVSDGNFTGLYNFFDTTDANGEYSIENIYYYDDADFTVSPHKSGHSFVPGSRERTLNTMGPTQANVNFTDTTVLTLSGTVMFAGTNCPVEDVDIYLDNIPSGIKTNSNGEYFLSINDIGSHTISVQYLHHDFSPSSINVNVQDDVTGVDFDNTTTDTLMLTLRGGCNNIIVDSAKFQISSTDPENCFSQMFYSDASSVLYAVVPAQEYRVELNNVYPFNTNITDQFVMPITVDLTQRDTVTELVTDTTYVTTPADTSIYGNGDTIITPGNTTMYVEGDSATYAKMARVDFVYHAGTNIELSNMPDTICVEGYNNVYLMLQDFSYPIVVQISESYTYNEVTTTCYLDTGTIDAYDMISEVGQTEIKIEDGYGFYMIEPENINLAAGGDHPYQRMLQLDIGNDSEFIWAFIDGHQPRTQTFITKTPEIPFFILHDPPGDGSYASVAEGSSWTRTYTSSMSYGGSAGLYWDLKFGHAKEIPLTGVKVKNYFQTKGEVMAGRNNTKQSTETRTWQATKSFSTSSSNLLIGNDADIYVGGSLNMIYGLTDVLEYDADSCRIIRDTSMFWGADSLTTTYVYTEEFIKNTLIPNLTTLRNLAQGDSVDIFQDYINVWEQVVENNNQVRLDALENPIDNISFSGGTSYNSSKTFSTNTGFSVSFNIFINLEVALGLGHETEAGVYVVNTAGVKFKVNWSQTKTESGSSTETTTRSYHLSDDDLGDYFSVDIARDSVHGTPVFGIVAGTTSCPHEPGTQPRDTADITLDHYVENNVPPNGQAVFTVNLVNLSQSGETRGYYVGMNTASNMDGAKIRLGGQLVTAGSIYYSLAPNLNHSVAMIVERGPLAYDYEDLQLRIYPFCFGLTEYLYAIGKTTVEFDVHFAHLCSSVNIFEPVDNWLVNQSNNNILQVVLNDYSTSSPYLENIEIQYRRFGMEWNTTTVIDAADLVQNFYDYAFDVSNLPDGAYELRARANCDFGDDQGYTYSLISGGVIDRYSLALFGTPSPADGILNISDEISVSFTEDIECELVYTIPDVTLTRDDTGEEISISYACYQNTMIIQTDPTSYIDSLEGVMLTAYVNNIQDLSYNMFTDGVDWSFIVNRSPVYWSPPNVEGSVTESETGIISAILVNEAGTAKNYVISEYAGWLTPSVTNGTIVSGGTNTIDFSVSNSLVTGIYKDTLIATIDGKSSLLYVTAYILDPSPWDFTNTGANHSIFIPYNAFEDIDINDGDYVGVFFDSAGTTKCGGYIDWNGTSTAVSAWGTEYDSINGTLMNGFADNEAFQWKVWNIGTGYSFAIVPSYASINFPNEGYFAVDGLSGILGFSEVEITGCMDPFATNYNANATTDDGSCLYDYIPAPWTVTNTGYNHTVIIYNDENRYTVNGNPIEVGDYIGAFYKKSDGTLGCGGYREWENFSSNQAITVWGANAGNDGFANGETFKWKIWSSSEGKEYMGYPTYDTLNFTEAGNYVTNGVSRLDSLLTRPFQSIPLVGHPNWNLFSTYMEADDPTVANIFSEIENDLQIVKNGAGQVYMPQHSVDLIGSIAIGEAYHLKMIASDSVALIIVGDTVDAANTILNLPATWSYLGYLHDTPQDVTDMMSDISSDIYILKDGAGQAYIPQWSVNNIGNMQPGMGYQIKLTSAHTFTYPAENNSKSLVPVYLADNTEYNAWHTITGNNMTLIIPNYAWADKPMQGDKVKVYDENGVLVGSGLYRDNNMAITIWGDDIHSEGTSGMISKEKFTIVLLRTGEADDFENQTGFFAEEEMLEVENWIAGDDYFETNKVSIAGKIKNTSFINNQTSIILYQNVPNPFSIKTNICFYLPEDANVQISLYNIVGELQEQLVSKEFNKGKHTIEFLSKNYASGTYLYKFTAGNFTATKQLNIMK